jgi:hypothetical protein
MNQKVAFLAVNTGNGQPKDAQSELTLSDVQIPIVTGPRNIAVHSDCCVRQPNELQCQHISLKATNTS